MTASGLEVAAWHESGHAVVCELLGGHVRMVTIRRAGAWTWLTYPADPIGRAATLWAGPIGESLSKYQAMQVAEWLTQPDYAALRLLPVHVRNRGFETAESLLLGDPDHAAQVAAVANALVRRHRVLGMRRLGGWRVRALMADPPPPEPLPSAAERLGFT